MSPTTSEPHAADARELAVIRPLFAAGFVTAFGAHSIAATLGAASPDLATHLLALGVLLALYDGRCRGSITTARFRSPTR